MPILGIIGSILISSLLAPKPPKAPEPAPAPKVPEVAPLPTPPAPPKKEPTVSPEDAAANAKAAANRRKRATDTATNPLETNPLQNGTSSIGSKTLLGE